MKSKGRYEKGPELFAAIEKAHSEGKTCKEVASIIGLSENTTNYYRNLLGLGCFDNCRDMRRAEVKKVQDLHSEGKTANEVAEILGYTASTINKRRRCLKLPPFKFNRNPLRKVSLDAIKLLQWEGKTAAEAAQLLGVAVTTINHHRRLMGLPAFTTPFQPPRSNSWTEAEDAELEHCIESGVSKADAAHKIGRSQAALQWRRRRLGLPRFKPQRPPYKPPRTWTEPRLKRLSELRAERMSYRKCALDLSTTRGAVAHAINVYLKKQPEVV